LSPAIVMDQVDASFPDRRSTTAIVCDLGRLTKT
jgi:hypothetical protein